MLTPSALPNVLKKPSVKVFKVSGTSMAAMGIQDGDLVAVDFNIKPVIGDVVVSLGEPNLLKSYFQVASEIRLYSVNGRTLPISGRKSFATVLGVLRGR